MAEKKQISLTIDDVVVKVPEGSTIMDAADSIGVAIPRLCYHPHLSILGACRVCLVDVEGARTLMAACSTPCTEGMVVQVNSKRAREARKQVVELLLSEHDGDC